MSYLLKLALFIFQRKVNKIKKFKLNNHRNCGVVVVCLVIFIQKNYTFKGKWYIHFYTFNQSLP